MTQVIKLKVLSGFDKALEEQGEAVRSAAVTAIKVESYRLRKVGKALIRKGELDIEKKSFLRVKDTKTRRNVVQKDNKNRGALRSFNKGFLYKFDDTKIRSEVGFVGTTAGTAWQQPILKKSLPGYKWVYSAREREFLHHKGIHIRKDTRHGKTPSRDIIEAILKHEGTHKIIHYVRSGFERKMRGERI